MTIVVLTLATTMVAVGIWGLVLVVSNTSVTWIFVGIALMIFGGIIALASLVALAYRVATSIWNYWVRTFLVNVR